MKKINQTLLSQVRSNWKEGEIHSLKWLNEQGVGWRFVQSWAYHYHKRGVFDKVGPGIYKLKNTSLLWEACVWFLQGELDKHFHIGGQSALELLEVAHFVPLGRKKIIRLFSYHGDKSPRCLMDTRFDFELRFKNSKLFSQDFFEENENVLLESYSTDRDFNIKVSCRELAIFELFNTIDFRHSFELAENYLEGLFQMKSDIIQALLENCNSIKVKRIFLYLSEKLHKSDYFANLDLSKVNLGKGKRQVLKGDCQFDNKYQITVPKEKEECPF